MVSLADLVRGAGDSGSHDWKEDLRRPDSVSRREGRTRLQKLGPVERKEKTPKANLRLSRMDIRVLRALATGKPRIARPRAAVKKNFKRNHPGIRFLSDLAAVRFLTLGKPGETYETFQSRLPAKVKVTPMGRAFRAESKTGAGGLPRTYHTGRLRAVLLKASSPPGGQGPATERIRTSNHSRSPERDETWIPLHVYAAWKVDGEPRGLSLADYHQVKTLKVRKRWHEPTASLSIWQGSDQRDNPSRIYPNHVAFYLDHKGRFQRLETSYYREDQIAASLQSLKLAGLARGVGPDQGLAGYRLTAAGWRFLEKLDHKLASKRAETRGRGNPKHRVKQRPRHGKLEGRERRGLAREKRHLERVARAVGFIPHAAMDPRYADRILTDWRRARRFYSRERCTHTGKRVRILEPSRSHKADYPATKRRELGHEWILAMGLKRIQDQLADAGATGIRFIPERRLRAQQTHLHQGSMPKNPDPNVSSLDHPTKGIPDGVVLYRDAQGEQQALAVEADAGGSPLANSHGYDEPTLALKDAWAQTRDMPIVYVVHTQTRAANIAKSNRQVMWVSK